jgi:dihydroflavonol-4-reductase
MNVFVTGATGFVGFHVARLLLEKGAHVKALARDLNDAAPIASLGAEPVKGDLRDADKLRSIVKGCQEVYHVAADYRLWVPDPRTMYDINVQGTKNVMEAALRASVEKVVYTSTVGVLATSTDGTPTNEDTPAQIGSMVGDYKRSKFLAEKEVYGFIEKGLPAVIVNPSTPIGPMDRKPTPTGKIIVDFLNGKIPAYLDTGLNFVDVEDVAAGHLLASTRGYVGQRYILGNVNMTLREFFAELARLTGRKPPRVRLPYAPVLLAAHVDEAVSRLTGRHPTIPLTGVRMAGKYMFFDCSKAIVLGMPQTPIENAIIKAVDWFEGNGYIRKKRA